MRQQAWRAFRLPFGAGHFAVVVFRNLEGDFGVDYLLTHSGWAGAEVLSSFDGDWYGPGLSWREIAHIAAAPDTTATGLHDPVARRLLLLPLLADDTLPPEASSLLLNLTRPQCDAFSAALGSEPLPVS